MAKIVPDWRASARRIGALAAVLALMTGLVVIAAPTMASAEHESASSADWVQAPSAPSARSNHAMAYDPIRERVVLFGGESPSAFRLDDTWEWDGESWTELRPTTSPPARTAHAMAFDPVRQTVVLFGGSASAGVANDMWEWNGTTWTQILGAMPPARYEHAMTLDQAHGEIVLFGGYSATNLGDTWTWNGAEWTQRVTTGPSARWHHAMAYDSAQGEVVLFGGNSSGAWPGDTWIWDGDGWAQRPASSPFGRYATAMGRDETGRVVLFGGAPGPDGGTWRWDGSAWVQLAPTDAPSARQSHAVAFDERRAELVLFGGSPDFSFPATATGDSWTFRAGSWSLATTTQSPPARYRHAMAYDSDRQRVVLFGGAGQQLRLADTWEWDGTSWQQHAAAGPSDRQDHAMVYDAARKVTILFGGALGSTNHGDMWSWNGTSWQQLAPNLKPSPRYGAAMAYDVSTETVLLFGGYDATGALADTWSWDGTTWTELEPATSPTARRHHTLAYDADRDRVVLHGGALASGAHTTDVWEWDGTTWASFTTSSSPPSSTPAMAYDSFRKRMVVAAYAYTAGIGWVTEAWEWDGTAWAKSLATPTPSSRFSPAVAYDEARAQLVFFGGSDLGTGKVRSDTWLRGPGEVCNGTDDDGDGQTDEFARHTFYADGDEDGFGDGASSTDACTPPAGHVATGTDCNDTNAAVNPGATEVANGADDDCDGQIDEGLAVTWYADSDADGYGNAAITRSAALQPAGYVANDDDCNDTSAAVNPNATEVPDDGIDQNCTGADLTTYHRDADGDGYGDPTTTQTSETGAPAGHVANGTDCNDTNATVNPAATEVANGTDDDCDGQIDEGLAVTWYADNDADGYGNPAASTSAALQPAGYVANDDDCNDTSAAVNPDATEIPDDGIDQDCTGADLTTYHRDADGDGYGDPTTTQTSETGAPAGHVADDDDADDSDQTIHPGAVELCDGKDNDQDGSVDENDACSGGDTDGDGISDEQDPDTVAIVVADLPASSFGGGGQQRATLDRLDAAEALIAAGDLEAAQDELLALRKRVDGCSGSAREKPDKNDWIIDCTDQHEVRDLLDELISNLEESSTSSARARYV